MKPDFTIDRKNKTFVFDDGEVLPIPEKDQREVLRTPHARKVKERHREIHEQTGAESGLLGKLGLPEAEAFKQSATESFLGNPGATAANYLTSAIESFSPGEGQEELSIPERIIDLFHAKQEGRKEALQKQGEKYPVSSGLGTGAGIVGEVGALGGLPAAAALPIMGAGHSVTSVLEPGKKLAELGVEGLKGFVLDKFFGALGKTAAARGERRGAQEAITSAEEANAAELARAGQATEADAARFAQQTAAREAELQALPGRQAAENEAWVNEASQRIDKVGKTIGKTPIDASVLGVEEFVEDVIGRSAHAGSTEGNRATKFLSSVFKGDKNGKMSAENLQKGVRALDEAIVSSEGATKELLTQFRNELIETLPTKITNSYIANKWAGKIFEPIIVSLEKDISKISTISPEINEAISKTVGKNYAADLTNSVRNSVEKIVEKYKGNLAEALENGSIKLEIQEAIANNPVYQNISKAVNSPFKANPKYGDISKDTYYNVFPGYRELELKIQALPEKLTDTANKIIDKNTLDVILDQQQKLASLNKATQNIPNVPGSLPQPAPVSPALTVTPNLQQVPVMPQPQGIYGRLASGLENLQQNGIGGALRQAKRHGTAGAIASFAGIPVAKGLATGLGVAKGAELLTRPGTIANAVRASFKTAGIGAIDLWAQEYPSYNNGVLENPIERRSLTKQIEDDQEIPLEAKAVAQSKVNRGRPIQAAL